MGPLLSATTQISKDNFTISLTHHPFTWFTDPAGSDFERTIGTMSHVHLFGHLHDADPVHRRSATGQTTYLQSPALFEHRKAANGYCLIYLSGDPPQAKLEYRTYFDTPRKFGSGENIIPGGGVFYPDDASKQYWGHLPKSISDRKFRNWLGGKVLSNFLSRTTDPTTGRVISEYLWHRR